MKQKIKWKKYLIIASCFVALVAIIEVIMQYTIHQRPELNIAELFLKENVAIANRYGNNFKTEYSKKGSSFLMTGNNTKGTYKFKIVGSKSNGHVSVKWEKTINTECKIFEIVSSDPWQQEKTIWKANN